MKKLDVLMIKSFIGPFILTTAVSNFILLIQYLLKYFDDFVGKNLGFSVFAELLFYFSLNMLQVALPLGVLVASLMTFGNLGENFELTAIKSSGISLPRTLRPIFLFVVILSIGAYFFNNFTIPAANLKAYSLLYDIKHTKPALDIKAGVFYGGIPNFSIKAREKLSDGRTLMDVIIYDHSDGRGNKKVILADSSIMYTIMNDRYLKLELFDGNYYFEQSSKSKAVDQLYRTKYKRMDMVFSLASFDLKRRKEELFQNNRQMKNINELTNDIDSFKNVLVKTKEDFLRNSSNNFSYHIKYEEKKGEEIEGKEVPLNPSKKKYDQASFINFSFFQSPILKPVPQSLLDSDDQNKFLVKDFMNSIQQLDKDSIALVKVFDYTKSINKEKNKPKRVSVGKSGKKIMPGPLDLEEINIDTLSLAYVSDRVSGQNNTIFSNAITRARNLKVASKTAQEKIYRMQKQTNLYTIERDKKYAQALACILMFLIGAPLGAIIKKGGLGVPTIIAIFFFIIYYVFTSIGEKSAKEGAMNPYIAVWLSDMVLLPFGLFFLKQARADARLFEVDFYNIWIEKLKVRFARKFK